MNSNSIFKTLIIIDLETTGLIYDQPKITELAMIAVSISTLEQMTVEEQLPRILNKFVKFFDPLKELRDEVVQLTGLNNDMLSVYKPFNRDTVKAMEAFLSDFQKPFCFVAHNGNLFDFPILFQEIQSALSTPPYSAVNNNNQCLDEQTVNISNDTLSTKDSCVQTTDDLSNQSSLLTIDCADSLVFFREIHRLLNDKDLVQYPKENIPSEPVIIPESPPDNPTTSSRLGYVELPIKYIPSVDPARQQPSMKLIKIYEREFNFQTSHLKSHRAEDDCLMLLAIIKRYLPDWLEWIERNHRLLNQFHSFPLTTTKKNISPKPIINTKPRLRF
jgi:DNA polymerase III epsilon subunit-like protein